jgi:hypothetical protein
MPAGQQHTESDAMTAIRSARPSLWYRVPMALLYLVTAGAAGPARFTPADATVPSPSPAEPCQYSELDVSAGTNSVATVYAPGQVATIEVNLHNPTSASFTDAYFDFQLVAPLNITAPPTAPTMSWSIDSGGWPGLRLAWTKPPAPQSPYWYSNDVALPTTIAAGSTHTLRFQASFHADSPPGFYPAILTIGARACFGAGLGTASSISYDYFNDLGRTGCCIGDHTGSSSGNTATGRPPSAPPTAPGSATPGAPSASPAPRESVNTVTHATPSASATPTPSQARNASSADPPKTAWLGVLLVLAVAALIGLVGQVVNTIRRHHPFG